MFGVHYDEDGNWSEHPLLVEAVGMPEVPDFHSENEEYMQLLASLEDIMHLRDALKQEGGINQSYAKQVHELVPAMEAQYPIGMYSQHISATQYRVSMEGLLSGAWQIIANIFKAIRRRLRRLFMWITGRDDPNPLSRGNLDEMEVKLKKENEEGMAVQKEIKAQAESISVFPKSYTSYKNHDGQVIRVRNYREFCNVALAQPHVPVHYVKAFYLEDPLWRDAVTHREYFKAIVTAVKVMPQACSMVVASGLVLSADLAKVADSNNEWIAKSEGASAMDESLKFAGADDKTLHHVAASLDMVRATLSSESLQNSAEHPIYDVIRMGQEMWDDAEQDALVRTIVNCQSNLLRLGQIDQHVNEYIDYIAEISSGANAELYREVVERAMRYGDHVKDLVKIISLAEDYRITVMKRMRELAGALSYLAKERKKLAI